MSHEHPGDGVRCDHCDQPGIPYEYKGRTFSGLISNRGEKLCPRCNGHAHDQFIHEHMNQPVQIWLPLEFQGIDGRDASVAGRRWVKKNGSRAA